VETKLGWTLLAENNEVFSENANKDRAVYMSVNNHSISQLWDLDTTGARDSTEVRSSEQEELEAKAKFIRNICRDECGRYVVKLHLRKMGRSSRLRGSLILQKGLGSPTPTWGSKRDHGGAVGGSG